MQGKINCESINGHLNSGQLNGQLSIDDLNIEIDQPVLNASLLQTSGLTGTINPGQGSGGHGREYHAGQGINITGSTINANVDGQTIIVNENNQLVANVEGDCNLITYDLDEYLALTTDERKVVFQEWVNILDDHDKQLRLHTSNGNVPYMYAEKYTTFVPNGIRIEWHAPVNGSYAQNGYSIYNAYLITDNSGYVGTIYFQHNYLQYVLTAGDNISISNNVISATVPDAHVYYNLISGQNVPQDILADMKLNPAKYVLYNAGDLHPFFYSWTTNTNILVYCQNRIERWNTPGVIMVGQQSLIIRGDTGAWTLSRETAQWDLGTGLSFPGTTISVDTSVIQEKLTAGSNIQINGSIISATDTTYTAGQNITIDANNVISASGDSVYGIIHYDPNNEPTFNSVKAIIDSGRIPVIIYDPADSNYPDTTNYQPLTEHSGIYNFAGCSSTGSTKYIDFIKSVYLPFPIDPQTGSTRLLHIGLYVDENDSWTFDANVKTD